MNHSFSTRLATALTITSVAFAAPKAAEETVQLERYVVSAAPMAGSFSTGNTPKAVLTPIEIVLVPGSAADINRALQTLPGVQSADEGNALFVRGGEAGETATWINGLRFPGRAQINAPLGTVSGTISAWQARKVDFAAGGFGAETGNVLSGAVKIETFGRPENETYSANLGIGGVAFSASTFLGKNAGTSITVGRDDLRAFLDLFDFKRTFDEAPSGYSYSIAGAWDYRADGKLKWFAVGQHDQLALRIRELNRDTVYRNEGDTSLQVLSWSDRSGAWSHEANLGAGQNRSEETISGQSWSSTLRNQQFSTKSAYDAGKFLLNLGSEGVFEDTTYTRTPETANVDERRFALWGEVDTTIARNTRMIAGLRGWDSHLARERGVDPRLAFTWQPHRTLTVSVAGGRYHQITNGLNYVFAREPWPAMRADQVIASVEWKSGRRLVRVETYEKRYRNMVGVDRDQLPHGDGKGIARGLDLMVKTPLPFEAKGRLTWSIVDADRTDPNTGQLTVAPWAVRHSLSLIIDRPIGDWTVSVAGRYATGRAFTPIIGGVDLTDGTGTRPIFGAPNSERLPEFKRVDFTLVRLWEINERMNAAFYFAGFNVFGWDNATRFEYSDDFTTRRPTPGVFQRSVYFGVNFFYR